MKGWAVPLPATRVEIAASPRQQVDAVHAWACAYVGRRLTSLGWEVRHEVEIGAGLFRGWIDFLGDGAVDRALLIGALERTTSWYERQAWRAARRFGWRQARHVVTVLALRQFRGRSQDPRKSGAPR